MAEIEDSSKRVSTEPDFTTVKTGMNKVPKPRKGSLSGPGNQIKAIYTVTVFSGNDKEIRGERRRAAAGKII